MEPLILSKKKVGTLKLLHNNAGLSGVMFQEVYIGVPVEKVRAPEREKRGEVS